MKTAMALAMGLTLAGCAVYGPTPGPYAAGPYGDPYVGAVAYDGYYDGYYGAFYDGYWRRDGAFYYRGREGDGWHRDYNGHFRREGANGYRPVHGGIGRGAVGHPGSGRPDGHPDGRH